MLLFALERTLHLLLGQATIQEALGSMKWILRYLKSTSSVFLRYGFEKPMLEGFSDSNMLGDAHPNRSTLGYDMMTCEGGVVSWQTRLQKVVALSTVEAEYMAAVEAMKELIWIRDFLSELGMKKEKFLLHCDNRSAIYLAKNIGARS